MNVLKFAAIDIGSNAIRLLFMNVIEENGNALFKKSSLVRVPIRLGNDTFVKGKISSAKIEKLQKTMLAFKYLMEVHEVTAYRACATSAMREASNGLNIVLQVKELSGINIEIIDGKQEAEFINLNKIAEKMRGDAHYLYVDVGGGSTEVTVFNHKEPIGSKSFDVGTVRLLNNRVSENDFKEIEEWLTPIRLDDKEVVLIGSGGNINKIVKLSGKKAKQQLLLNELVKVDTLLHKYSSEDRIKVLGLNTDRADVIIHASDIFLKIMRWSGAKRIIIPTIGVSDGIVHQLYADYKKQHIAK